MIWQSAYFAAMCSKFLCPLPGAKLMLNLEFERRSDTDLCKVKFRKNYWNVASEIFKPASLLFFSHFLKEKKLILRPISYVQYIYISKYWTCMEKIPRIFQFFFFFTNKSLLVTAFTSRKWLARMKTNFLQGMKHWYFWFNQNTSAQLIFQHHISPTWYFHVICIIPIGSKHWIKSNGKDTLHKV